jgi:DNA-binding transcriptional ArsR family regulator
MSLESMGTGRETAGETTGPGEQKPGQRWRVLDDPLAIRALAHPLRLDLLTVIGRLGKATTADAARELGISHGLASHHLHQLAKYGFAEQVAGKDNRERPWRLTATSYLPPRDLRTPGLMAAADVFDRVLADRIMAGHLDWQRHRSDWPDAWLRVTGLVNTSTVYLTLPELTALTEAIKGLIQPYVEERVIDDATSRPPGSVPVDLALFAVPDADAPPAASAVSGE